MTTPTSPDRSVSDDALASGGPVLISRDAALAAIKACGPRDGHHLEAYRMAEEAVFALASGGPAGDGGFDWKKPFTTRDGRLVSGIAGVLRPALSITGIVSGEEMSWDRETGKSWTSRNLDLVNIDVDSLAVPPTSVKEVDRLAADMWHAFRLTQDIPVDWPTWGQLLAEGHQGAARVGQFRSFAKAALNGRDEVGQHAVPLAPAGDMAGEDDAAQAARRWIEDYGIRTEPYTRSGGDHPMMMTLPQAFEAFALAREGARRSVAGDGWQPIDTAPKDKGEHDILVFCADSGEMFVAFWHAGNGWQYAVDPITCRAAVCQPSHWRPLPASPGTGTNATTPTTTPVTPLEEAMCRTLMRLEGRAAYADRTGDFYDCGLDKSLPAWMAKLWWVREFLAAHPVLAASPDGAGSGSEPEAWQIKDFGGEWISRSGPSAESRCRKEAEDTGALVRPLYAAPPASVDAVAVVKELRDKWRKSTSNAGSAHAAFCNDARCDAADEILAALRARQQATEARS